MQTHKKQASAPHAGALAITALAAFLLIAPSANAQTSPPTPQTVAPGYTPPTTTSYASQPAYVYVPTKAGTWDFYLNLGYQFYDSQKQNDANIWNPFAAGGLGANVNGNLKIKYDDAFTYGFGFGYNFNDRFSIGAEFSYSDPSYDASFSYSDDTGSHRLTMSGDADVWTGDLYAQFNVPLTKNLTFFGRGTVGFYYLDTGIPTGPTEYYWWWDWWWGGYDLVGSTPTQSDTYLSLGLAAGLRYDFQNHVYLHAYYNAAWVDTPHNWSINQRINLAVGWNY